MLYVNIKHLKVELIFSHIDSLNADIGILNAKYLMPKSSALNANKWHLSFKKWTPDFKTEIKN